MDHISLDRVSFDNTSAAEVIIELFKGSTEQILNWFNICFLLPESHVALRNGFVLQHPHTRLQPQLLLVQRHPHLVVVDDRPFLRTTKTPRPSRPRELLGRVKEVLLDAWVSWEPLEGVGHAPGQHHACVREEGIHARWQQTRR